MPAKVLLCPVLRRRYQRSQGAAKVRNHQGRYHMKISRRTILQGCRSAAFGGREFRLRRTGADDCRRPKRDRIPAGPVRAWQWRPRGAVDDHAVADGIERGSARSHVRDQFHRSAGARRRHQGRAEQIIDRGPAPRTRRSRAGIEAPHRRNARGLGRQFARRLFDSRLHQEWRRSRRQPRRAVRRSQSRRLCLGRRSQQRVQRSRPVPARPERGRERSDRRAPRS